MTDAKFGEKVRYLRERKNWKQQTLADKAGLSQSEVSRIEKGYVRGEDQIKKVAEALGYAPETLVRGTTWAPLFCQSPVISSAAGDQGGIVAYFASALTELTEAQKAEIKQLDEKVNEICQSYSAYPVNLYRPRTTPTSPDNPKMAPSEVYDTDRLHVATADLLILGAIFPSLGAGMEMQLALESCTSVVVIKKATQRLSRMVLGCPAQMQVIEYDDVAELESKLPKAIDAVVKHLAQYGFANDYGPKGDIDELGKRISNLRDQRKLTRELLAERVGVGTAYIESLETNPELISNPSLHIIRRLAKALLTSEAYLISGSQSLDSPFLEHSDSLRTFAEQINMPIRDFNELWNEHYGKHRYDFVSNADNRADIGNERYWTDRYAQLQKSRENGKRLF